MLLTTLYDNYVSALCLQLVALPQLMQAQQKATTSVAFFKGKISRSHTVASLPLTWDASTGAACLICIMRFNKSRQNRGTGTLINTWCRCKDESVAIKITYPDTDHMFVPGA